MPAATNGAGHAVLMPVIVPRKIEDNHLYFYVVFLQQHQTPGEPSPIPACMMPTGKTEWPEYIIKRLRNDDKSEPAQAERATFHLLNENKTSFFDTNQIEVLTPPDMAADKLDLADQGTLMRMGALWAKIYNSWIGESNAKQTFFGHRRFFTAADTVQGNSTGRAPTNSIVHVYESQQPVKVEAGQKPNAAERLVVPNPAAASDLRPRHRIESIDPRRIAEAFHASASTTAAAQAAANAGTTVLLPYGVHLVLLLGYTAPDTLNAFIKYERSKGKRGGETAEFVEQVWRMYGREYKPSNDSPVATRTDLDPRFNDVLRGRLDSQPAFKKAVESIHDAYWDFLLHQGQTEVRRLSRFIDSSRHRHLPGFQGSGGNAPAPTSARLAAFTTVAKVTAPDPPELFGQLMGQIRQHPGLMRRVAISVYCKVPFDKPHQFSGFACLSIPVSASSGWKFYPAKTACEIGSVKVSKAEIFRATVAKEHDQAFFGPETDEQGNRSDAEDYWRWLHVFPRTLYAVSQEDVAIAAARAGKGVSVANAAADTLITRSDSLNIYALPCDSVGQPVTRADVLVDVLEKSQKQKAEVRQAVNDWLQSHSLFRLAANVAGPGGAAADDVVFYADQLMQGVTVMVRRKRNQAAWGPWRSLCRRHVEVTFDESASTSDKERSVRQFDEEGFVSTSTTTAAQPLVGRALIVPPKLGLFQLQVVTVKNHKSDQWDCNPIVEDNQKFRISGMFRPRLDWDDFKKGDFALVTPVPPPANPEPLKTNVTELVVHPIFLANVDLYGQCSSTWSNDVTLALAVVGNKEREEQLPGNAVPQKELFAFVLSHFGTRFLDSYGNERPGTPPDPENGTYRFTAEGQRRYFALRWARYGTSSVFAPVGGLSPDDIETRKFGPMTGVLSHLGSADVVSPWHLTKDDTCDVLTLPAPHAPNSGASSPKPTFSALAAS